MVQETFGRGCAMVAAATLLIAAIGSLVTEFTGVAGIGEIYHIPRFLSLAAATALVIAIALSGSYRRIERIALMIGAFEAAFFVIAWQSNPNFSRMSREAFDCPCCIPISASSLLRSSARRSIRGWSSTSNRR